MLAFTLSRPFRQGGKESEGAPPDFALSIGQQIAYIVPINGMEQNMAKKHRRVPVEEAVQTQVLVSSERRCCLCYYLFENRGVRKGQIAHLKDRSNSDFENLVWLCLEHHDEFDSQTSQSKGLTSQEVKVHRDRLYRELGTSPANAVHVSVPPVTPNPVEQLPSELRNVIEHAQGKLDHLLAPWKLMAWEDVRSFLFAFKASNRCDGICRIERLFLSDGRIAVICTQIAGNPGESVTNAVESIAFQVCAQFKIDPTKLVWIEHYANEGALATEWFLVSFQSRPPTSMFEHPAWKQMTRDDWTALGLRPRGKERMLKSLDRKEN